MDKHKTFIKALSVIFLITVAETLIIAANLEQGYITIGTAVAEFIINFLAMAVSGFMSGMLTIPKERTTSQNND